MIRFGHILFFLFLTSCAGYRVRDRGNPFEQENIHSLAIPMFVNKSSYPGVGPIFTREVTKLMSSYPGIRIKGLSGGTEDAVLVGIIESPRRYADAYKTTATKFTDGELEQSIGNRAQFYLPTASSYAITLRLILIKNPSIAEKELLASSLGAKMENISTSKIIFQQSFNYTGAFNREAKDTITSDSGGIVNYSKTKRYFTQTIENLAKQAARDLEDLVINVF
ncbi:MAG: hypothetical protein K9K67_09175 [Bacteriovoracaceae bacterium]|nr:hypothetical protein [Bacteriovoracaceae bacterium]